MTDIIERLKEGIKETFTKDDGNIKIFACQGSITKNGIVTSSGVILTLRFYTKDKHVRYETVDDKIVTGPYKDSTEDGITTMLVGNGGHLEINVGILEYPLEVLLDIMGEGKNKEEDDDDEKMKLILLKLTYSNKGFLSNDVMVFVEED
jgi:hypothetical protein